MKGASSLQKLVFPAILPCKEPGMSKDYSLCPVQALKVCLAKSGDKRNKELLFISNKIASKETFTQFALCRGGKAALLNARCLLNEVGPLAASLVFKGSVDTEAICQPAWAPHSSFLDFYLWDIALLTEHLHRLGPILAAQRSSCSKIPNSWASFGGVVSFLPMLIV